MKTGDEKKKLKHKATTENYKFYYNIAKKIITSLAAIIGCSYKDIVKQPGTFKNSTARYYATYQILKQTKLSISAACGLLGHWDGWYPARKSKEIQNAIKKAKRYEELTKQQRLFKDIHDQYVKYGYFRSYEFLEEKEKQ
tara:strand:+ start:642 stop:1061 length:420 start_codon:yes stop_codon:yes gene_type:complete